MGAADNLAVEFRSRTQKVTTNSEHYLQAPRFPPGGAFVARYVQLPKEFARLYRKDRDEDADSVRAIAGLLVP